MSLAEFKAWYTNSSYWEKHKELNEEMEEEGAGVDLRWPSQASVRGKICYVITLPLVALMYFTLPDVRKPRFRNWFALTFAGAIIHVMGYVTMGSCPARSRSSWCGGPRSSASSATSRPS